MADNDLKQNGTWVIPSWIFIQVPEKWQTSSKVISVSHAHIFLELAWKLGYTNNSSAATEHVADYRSYQTKFRIT